jgi:hypothetical protein
LQYKNKQVTNDLLTRAEAIKSFIGKLEKGNNLTKEEIAMVKSVKPELVLGYDETERLKRKFTTHFKSDSRFVASLGLPLAEVRGKFRKGKTSLKHNEAGKEQNRKRKG